MALHYIENPVLFLNSGANFVIPNGRNARIKYRAQEAAAHSSSTANENAHFGVLNFRRPHPRSRKGVKAGGKRRTQKDYAENETCNVAPCILAAPRPALDDHCQAVVADPANVLAVATFHIRRSAALTLKRHPDRLVEVLRCRQWSSLSITSDRLGRCRCLDHALTCVASKLAQITSGPTSNYLALSRYTCALQSLQVALNRPSQYDISDLQATTQLLAVFEMLDSIDSAAWRQHVTGAEILSRSNRFHHDATANSRRYAISALPMIADAMLNGNVNFFKFSDWQTPIRALLNGTKDDEHVALCLSDVPELLVKSSSGLSAEVVSEAKRYELLDRAHAVKARLRNELLKSNLYESYACGENTSLDELGLCLAGLVCLDRLISCLRPVPMRAREIEKDETAELCSQMLRLELRASDAYPPPDLLSAFELAAT